MAQLEVVSVLSPEYAKYLLTAGTNTQESTLGGGWYLEKNYADSLVALANATNTKIVLENTYRKPFIRVDGGKTPTSYTHGLGMSADVVTYVSEGETLEAAVAQKHQRRLELGATVLTDENYSKQISFGGSKYRRDDSGPQSAKSLLTGEVIRMAQVNMSENQHFESRANTEALSKMSSEEVMNFNAAVEAMGNTRDSRPGQLAVEWVGFDGKKVMTPARPAQDLRVKGFTVDTKTGAISKVEYMDRAGIALKQGQLKSDNSPLVNKPTPVIDPALKKTYEIKKRGGGGGTDTPYDEFSASFGSSDGKQGNMGEFMSFNPSAVPIPSRAKDGTIPRVVEIDSRQFNNGIDNYRDAAQIKRITNKLVKNAMPGRHPFGAQLKQDGPPAAIKLVLDDVFKSKRTPEAVKAWERIVSSGIDYIDNFVIARMSEVNAERYQILQSVTDDYKIYFSGKSPVVTSIGGHMLNTYNQQWWYDFEYFYDNYLRGSKAVENKIRAFLTIADTIYDILILKFGVQIDANFDDSVMFSIDFVTLQKLHIGEYQTPDQRGADKNNAPKSANMSSTQTEYSDSTKQLIENMTLDSESAGARGYPGTSVKNSTVDLNELEYALGGKGAIDTSKYNLDNIKTFNPSGATSQIASNQKSARDDLKNTPYADLQRQLRLSKSSVNSGTPLDTINAMANTNNQERNSAPLKPSTSGAEYFSKGASAAVGKYDSARKLTQQELTQSFKTLGSDISGIESSANAIMNNMKTDARKFEQSTVNSREDIERIWANNPRDVNDFMNRVGDSVPALNNLAMQSGKFSEEFKQNYEVPVKNLGRDVKNTLKVTGNLLKGLGQGFVDSFNAGKK